MYRFLYYSLGNKKDGLPHCGELRGGRGWSDSLSCPLSPWASAHPASSTGGIRWWSARRVVLAIRMTVHGSRGDSLDKMEIELGLDGSSPPADSNGRVFTAADREGSSNLILRARKPTKYLTCVNMFRVAAGATFLVLVVALVNCAARDPQVQRSVVPVCRSSGTGQRSVHNVVFMIPDGMGPAYLELTKGAMPHLGRPDTKLALDTIEVGVVHTRSRSDATTDSAAAATAYATGFRTDNGNVSEVDGKPLATVLEGAEAAGMWTGLVTTARITHATPAGFSSHIDNRDKENDIAVQQLQKGIEVMMGGGRQHFVPKGEKGSKREDESDLEALAEHKGYNIMYTTKDLEAARIPALGLFSDSHMAFEIDRAGHNMSQPSLAEMTRKALQLLSSAPYGFFLMVEGGRIDHAGHMNDPVAAVHDVLAYDEAVSVVLDFARWDGRTAVVSVADHETGGLFQGGDSTPDYEALAKITSSAEFLSGQVQKAVLAAADRSKPGNPALANIAKEVLAHAGLATDDMQQADADAVADAAGEVGQEYNNGGLPLKIGDAISHVLGVNWTSSHHTPVDVVLGAFAHERLGLKESMDNSELGGAVIEALGVRPEEGMHFTADYAQEGCNLA